MRVKEMSVNIALCKKKKNLLEFITIGIFFHMLLFYRLKLQPSSVTISFYHLDNKEIINNKKRQMFNYFNNYMLYLIVIFALI